MKTLWVIIFIILPIIALADANTPELAVNNYYETPAQFNKILSLHTNDEETRKEFKKHLNAIFTGELLESWTRFVDNTNINSTFYN